VTRPIRIGSKPVGEGNPCYLVAEVGINHNGDIELAKMLMQLAKRAGFDAVKFQKRTIEVVYTKEELAKPREHPWGTTNGDLKRRLELGREHYEEIDRYSKEIGIDWFASCWDEPSVDFIDEFAPPAFKISSASLTDDKLLRYTRAKGKPIILSTGMSTMEQVEHAVDVLGTRDLIILHAVSTYPAKYEEINLRVIPVLQQKFPETPIGYSGHESGLASTVAAIALGARMVERHITLDRAMFGTDHAASLGPSGFEKLTRDIRLAEAALGDGQKRLLEAEVPIMKKLRRIG
jgi:N-acetylneuraminate synthase